MDEYRQIASAGAITTLFQPIVTLGTMSIFGYEALSRGPSDSPLHNPIVLFDTARHANPLTGLPGNVPIYEHLDDAIQQKDRIVVAYFDLDNFKPFNDVYGYARGDAVIRLVAMTLEEHLGQHGDFLGHVGGDDFIIVFRSDDWQMRCEQILTIFSQQVGEHYRTEDRDRGGIFALSRDGEERFFPLVTLSIGAICPDMATVVSHGDIADMASRAKHNAKDIPGSSLCIERREHLPSG